MECKEPPMNSLYEYVEQYRQEMNLTPMQWYMSNVVRERFWYWLEYHKGQKPLVMLFTQERNSEAEEMYGASIDVDRYER
jgi:hypothetical protein